MPATHRQLLLALSLLLVGLIFPANRASGAAWAWQYDALGQLTNASREQDAAAVAGAQFAYNYDGIGNRLAASRRDTPDAASHAEQKTYTPNLLNQYTSRTQPGTVTVSRFKRDTLYLEKHLPFQVWLRPRLPLRGIPAKSCLCPQRTASYFSHSACFLLA